MVVVFDLTLQEDVVPTSDGVDKIVNAYWTPVDPETEWIKEMSIHMPDVAMPDADAEAPDLEPQIRDADAEATGLEFQIQDADAQASVVIDKFRNPLRARQCDAM